MPTYNDKHQPTPPSQTPSDKAGRVATLMNLALEAVSPSKISSHVKGDVLVLLQRLRDEEILRILNCTRK